VSEPFPNPSSGAVSLSTSDADGALSARVYDVSGGLVRTMTRSDGERALMVWMAATIAARASLRASTSSIFRTAATEIRRRVSILR